MSIPIKRLPIFKGTDKSIPLYISDSTGAIDLTDYNVYFYVKETISGDAIITKDTDGVGGITKDPDQETYPGKATITIDDTDTESLDAGRYYYQVFTIDGSDKKKAILAGYFWIYEVGPNLVDDIRDLLGDGGELRVNTVPDELLAPATLTTVYVPRQRITSVDGVWLATDTDHSGTNYYTGGGFDANSGKIWLGTPLTTTGEYVRVSYTWESGVNDDAIWQHLYGARNFTINWTGIEFTFGNCTTYREKGAESMSIAGAIIGCVLTMNGANVAQLGYNFRLDEFEIQSKLWGEGMIAQALFKMYFDEYEKWKQALGKDGQIYIVSSNQEKYDLNTLIGFSSENAEGGE